MAFVNYARPEDFKKLKELGVSVAGHIVIAKYGKNFRGDKVRGLLAIIIIRNSKYLSRTGIRVNSGALIG